MKSRKISNRQISGVGGMKTIMMEIHLPNFKGEVKTTLYYIGNGFDLFHGLRTKFIHFYSWLNLKDDEHEKFAYDMECIFPRVGIHGNWLWTDFEKSLGEIDVDYIHDKYSGKEKDIFYDEEYQERAAHHLRDVTSRIPYYLSEWLKETYYPCVKNDALHLHPESRYLSFNYTSLLEDVYKIPKDQVLHIHGNINSQKPLTTGHIVQFPDKDEDPQSYNMEKSWQNITQEANNLRKPVDKIIKENKQFFTSLSDIKNIVIFGHSLSSIDRQYFKEVVQHVHDNARWYFVCINDIVQNSYHQLVRRYHEKLNREYRGNELFGRKIIPENCEYLLIQ